jgi:hypothetical protein
MKGVHSKNQGIGFCKRKYLVYKTPQHRFCDVARHLQKFILHCIFSRAICFAPENGQLKVMGHGFILDF